MSKYPHMKALASPGWDCFGSERERERAVEGRQLLADAEIAERVRQASVGSIGKVDPEWSTATAYEKAQERLVLWILLGVGMTCRTCGGTGWRYWWCDIDDNEHIRQQERCPDCVNT